MGIQAFTKLGNTVTFIADTVAPTAVQAASTTLGGNQYRLINAGTNIVFLGYGTSAAIAAYYDQLDASPSTHHALNGQCTRSLKPDLHNE